MQPNEISSVPNRGPSEHKRQERSSGGLGRTIGRTALRVLACLLALAAALLITVLLSLRMICSSAFPTAQQLFVTTILETGQLKFLASWFLSPDEIQAIVDQNSMEALDAQVDSTLIQIGDAGPENAGEAEADIEIVEVAGATYTGTMMIVQDPSRVSLATIYPWREVGVTLDELVESNGAIAGINGGLYDSTNNTGGRPLGVIVSHGEIQYNKPQQYPGLVLVGFTEDHLLQIIDIDGMTAAQVEELVKREKIRDAVTFQEEASDSNNHFVQLIINNETRDMKGQGSGLNPRTAIGQRADGAVLLFVTDGRGKSGHLGASSGDLIQVMQEFGAVNAANLDGGSSSCMYYDGEYLMPSVTFYYANSSWRLPAGFVVT